MALVISFRSFSFSVFSTLGKGQVKLVRVPGGGGGVLRVCVCVCVCVCVRVCLYATVCVRCVCFEAISDQMLLQGQVQFVLSSSRCHVSTMNCSQ